MEEAFENLKKITDQLSRSIEINEYIKMEAMSKLTEKDKEYVRSVESVAKKFADQQDISGLMNYLNSVQEKKMKRDAGND